MLSHILVGTIFQIMNLGTHALSVVASIMCRDTQHLRARKFFGLSVKEHIWEPAVCTVLHKAHGRSDKSNSVFSWSL